MLHTLCITAENITLNHLACSQILHAKCEIAKVLLVLPWQLGPPAECQVCATAPLALQGLPSLTEGALHSSLPLIMRRHLMQVLLKGRAGWPFRIPAKLQLKRTPDHLVKYIDSL